MKQGSDERDELGEIFDVIRDQNRETAERGVLDHLLGVWDVQVDFFFLGTSVRKQAYGVADGRHIVGGRYLQLAIATDYDGNSYNALIILCFDAVIGRYMSVLLDNTVTSLMTCRGDFDGERRLLTEEGEFSNAAFGRRHPIRATWDLTDDNSVDLLWEAPLGEDGAWFSVLRALMTRRPDEEAVDL